MIYETLLREKRVQLLTHIIQADSISKKIHYMNIKINVLPAYDDLCRDHWEFVMID